MVKFELKGKTHNFFHIPKTGGTSLIEGVIWNNFKYFHMFELFPEYTLGPNHLSYREYEEVGAVLPDDINITIVREPIALGQRVVDKAFVDCLALMGLMP